MAARLNQKLKILYILDILKKYSDEETPINATEICEKLFSLGVTAERKSIYSDIDALIDYGYDIIKTRTPRFGYFLAEREFELPELKLLADAVASSRFITHKKSEELIGKLAGLTSKPQANRLRRQVYVDRRIKTMNESIFYNVDKLHTAIAANRIITFRYFEYNMKKERVFRREGARYRVTPFGLVWDNENYYLAVWDETKGDLRHYRVDKMADILISNTVGTERGDWDPEGYAGRHFGMYSGRSCSLRLRCRSNLAGVVIDRFGQDVMLVPDGDEHFTVTVELVVSPPFWGWLFSLGSEVELLSPSWAVEEFRQRLDALKKVYENSAE